MIPGEEPPISDDNHSLYYFKIDIAQGYWQMMADILLDVEELWGLFI